MADNINRPQQTGTSSTDTTNEAGLDPDFASAPGLSRDERTVVRRLSNVLRITDFMTFLMVIATGFSAYATWRTAYVTSLLFSVAERPYIGVQNVSVDSLDANFARLVVDCRNYGHVQAKEGVVQVGVAVDGKLLPKSIDVSDTENIGIVSPTVPHRIFRFVPRRLYDQARDGRSRIEVHIDLSYRGPDLRQFCYHKLLTYDRRTTDFIPSAGNDRCDAKIY